MTLLEQPDLEPLADDLADRIARWGRDGGEGNRVPDDLTVDLEQWYKQWHNGSEQTIPLFSDVCKLC